VCIAALEVESLYTVNNSKITITFVYTTLYQQALGFYLLSYDVSSNMALLFVSAVIYMAHCN